MILSTKFGTPKKNGEAQFYVRLIVNGSDGKRIERRIKVKGVVMAPAMLNLRTWRVRSTYPQADLVNQFLLDYRNKLSSIISMYDRGDITFDMACNLASSGNAIDSVLDYVQNIFGRDKKDTHLQNCINTVVTITNKLGLASLAFSDLTEDNLLKVKREMLESNKSPESFNKYFRDLKAIWNHAKERNFVIGKSPFRKEVMAKAPPVKYVPTASPEQISAAINRIRIEKGGRKSFAATVGRFQAVAMWLLKFSMRGFYRKDIESLTAHDLAYDFKRYIHSYREGYYQDKIPGNSLLLFHGRHKTGIPMEIFLGIPPILALIRYLRLTIAYTHPTLSFNSAEELGLARTNFKKFLEDLPESRVDPLRFFKPMDKDNKKKFVNYWRLLGDRRKEIGLPSFLIARHTFTTYCDGLGFNYNDSKQLIGHKIKGATDNYINKRTERIMARIAKEHLEVLQDFKTADLFEQLLDHSVRVLGDFGEYLNENCQIGVYSPYLNANLGDFLSEKASIPNQRQYQEMKEMILKVGVDAIEFEKAMEDPLTEEERKLYNEKFPLLTDKEYQEEVEGVRRDRELGLTDRS